MKPPGDVFESVLAANRDYFRRSVLNAALELGIAQALLDGAGPDEAGAASCAGIEPNHRLTALLDVMAVEGIVAGRWNGERRLVLTDEGARALAAHGSDAVPLPREGWGRLAKVIRRDRPLAEELSPGPLAAYHTHLMEISRPPAQELAERFLGQVEHLLDVGSGSGGYSAAFLQVARGASVTLVDRADVLSLAAEALEALGLGDRVKFAAGEFPEVPTASPTAFSGVLMANLLHLYGPGRCAEMVSVARGLLGPGGTLVVKDLHLDVAAKGPAVSLWFSLNMALHTPAGRVHPPSRVASWLDQAGFEAVEVLGLQSSPNAAVVRGTAPV